MRSRFLTLVAVSLLAGFSLSALHAADSIPVTTAIYQSTSDNAVPVTETGHIHVHGGHVHGGIGLGGIGYRSYGIGGLGYRSYGFGGYPYSYRSSYYRGGLGLGIGLGLGYRSYGFGGYPSYGYGYPYGYGSSLYRSSFYGPSYGYYPSYRSVGVYSAPVTGAYTYTPYSFYPYGGYSYAAPVYAPSSVYGGYGWCNCY